MGDAVEDVDAGTRLRVDGVDLAVPLPPLSTLADALQSAGIGVSTGCRDGYCGLCLVEIDGRPARACLTPLGRCDGTSVRTAADPGDPGLDVARRHLSDTGGLQCGYCSPAFALLLAAAGRSSPTDGARPLRVEGDPSPDDPSLDDPSLDEVVCRCTGYRPVVAAAERIRAGADAPPRWRRVEDERLLTGRGTFVTSRVPDGALHARVVRSARPHAVVTRLDVSAARELRGVVAVLTGADLPPAVNRLHDPAPGPVCEPLLATSEVRYVGQPVALVLAESLDAAVAGVRAVRVEYAELPDEAGPEARPPDPGDARWLPVLLQRVGAREPAPPGAVSVRKRLVVPRQTAVPMELRGCAASYEGGRLTVAGVTKHPALTRAAIARVTGLPERDVEVPRGDVGGSFGVRGEVYPEELLIPLAALGARRPVWWSEERDEHLTAVSHSRGQVWDVTLIATRDGVLHSAEVEVQADCGAYLRPLTTLVGHLASAMFPGPYRLPRYHARVRPLITTRAPVGMLRAPGRFEANVVREHLLDLLADRLHLEPDVLRRRNLLTQADMPYDVGTLNEGPVHYDTGDFAAAFERALDRTPPVPDPRDGRCRATATVPYVEKAGLAGLERAVLRVTDAGGVEVVVASAPSGQGHESTITQVVVSALDLPAERVRVSFSDALPDDGRTPGAVSVGTFASRSAMYTGNAVLEACRALAAELRAGGPATSGDGAPAPIEQLLARHPGLCTSGEYQAAGHTYPYGTVTCSVAVDPELLTVEVEHLAVSADVGHPIRADIVRGQLLGGVVQGVSAALQEELPYRDGWPLVRGLSGYPLVLASDVPPVEVDLLAPAPPTHRSALNPLGARGVGESGIAAAGAAVACAVTRALPAVREGLDRLPLTPSVLHAALGQAVDTPRGTPIQGE